MKTDLYPYKGRKFVRLCKCNSNYFSDRAKFGVAAYGGQMLFVGLCNVCENFKWIILPKGEKI